MNDKAPAYVVDSLSSRSRAAPIVLIEVLAAALLVLLVVLVLTAIVFRYFLGSPIIYADEVASFIFLWFAMLGTGIAMHRSEHLRLTLLLSALPEDWRRFFETLGPLLVGVFLIVMLPFAIEHVVLEGALTSPALGISNGYRVCGIVVGLALMLVMVVVSLWEKSNARDFLLASALIILVALLLWAASPFLPKLGKANILIFLVGGVALCLAIGVPIAFCFGLGTLAFLVFSTHLPLTVIIGRMDEGMSSLVLLSVPFFIFLGCILDVTGMGKAIVEFIASLVGHVRAGMSYVLLGALYLVSGISGSKVSDMATVAPALFPEMKRRGAKPAEMVALLGTGAIMADTVPPSIVLIVVGSIANLSIGALFLSGFVVAFFLLLILVVVVKWKSSYDNLEGVKRAPLATVGRTLLIASPALVLPFLIRSAVTEGVATATEVSTIAVLYALLSGIFIYGGITRRQGYNMLVDTASMTGTILLILGTASAAAWALTQTGFAAQLGMLMQDLPGGWIVFMGVTIVAFLVLGCLLEGLPAVVLLGPLMFPIAKSLGINGIHYAMVVIVAMNIGIFTPPVGIGYYLACSIGKVPPDEAMRAIWVYLAALLVGLIAIALIPAISIGIL